MEDHDQARVNKVILHGECALLYRVQDAALGIVVVCVVLFN